MMEYSDEPAYSHSPCSSFYSILCKQTFVLPPEGLSLLPGKGPILCTHIQGVVWCMTGRIDGGCLSLHSGKTGGRVGPQVFYSCCRWTVYVPTKIDWKWLWLQDICSSAHIPAVDQPRRVGGTGVSCSLLLPCVYTWLHLVWESCETSSSQWWLHPPALGCSQHYFQLVCTD